MKSRFVIFALAISMLVTLAACSQGRAIESGEVAQDFTLNDINNKPVTLSEFKGKVIILDFFASWCPPCKEEIPDFIELQKAYGDKGAVIVGVALVDLEDAKAFAAKMGINYPVLIDDGKASEIYGPVRSIPTTFIISKDFKVIKTYIGFRPKDVFENDIKELLK